MSCVSGKHLPVSDSQNLDCPSSNFTSLQALHYTGLLKSRLFVRRVLCISPSFVAYVEVVLELEEADAAMRNFSRLMRYHV